MQICKISKSGNDIFDIQFFNKIVVDADDLKLFGYKLQNLQSDLDKLLEWSTDNKIYINIAKCEVLHLGTESKQRLPY